MNCPRCGSPRFGDFCQSCGWDYRTSVAPVTAPVRQPGDQEPAPFSATSAPSNHALPIALALVGISLLVLASAVFVVAPKGSAHSSATAAHVVAVVSPSQTAGPVVTDAPTAAPLPSSPPGPEPAPVGVWTTYTPKDGGWSATFPGVISPVKNVTTYGSGPEAYVATTYMVVTSSDARYAVQYADFTAAYLVGRTAGSFLDLVQESFTSGTSQLVQSADSTEVGYPSRDVVLLSEDQIVTVRMWLVGLRLYLLYAGGKVNDTVYPLHFFANFKLYAGRPT